jgi:hypothetical protein
MVCHYFTLFRPVVSLIQSLSKGDCYLRLSFPKRKPLTVVQDCWFKFRSFEIKNL